MSISVCQAVPLDVCGPLVAIGRQHGFETVFGETGGLRWASDNRTS